MKFIHNVLLFALVFSAFASHAATLSPTEAVKDTLTRSYPGIPLKSIRATEAAGILEAVVGADQVVYVTADGKYLMVGELIEISTKRNVTRETVDELTKIDFSSLPVEKAIRFIRGNGTSRLAVFSDPDCAYCKKLEQELHKLADATVYTFPFPIATLHPDAYAKSSKVLCSDAPGQAWKDLMLKGVTPETSMNCDKQLDELIAIGEKLNIKGTPTVYMENGVKLSGSLEAAAIQKRLAAARLVGDKNTPKP